MATSATGIARAAALIGALASGCATTTFPSVARFGAATGGFADGMEVAARDSARVCEDKQRLSFGEALALGSVNAELIAARIEADECKRFRELGTFYSRLARQLGAFGQAMQELASAGEADYTDQLSSITASEEVLKITGIPKARIEQANGLMNKILRWFAGGYSADEISDALKESAEDVKATLALLTAVLEAYDVQVDGYAQLISQIGSDAEFTTRVDTDSDTSFEVRKAAQKSLVEEHSARAQERRRVLAEARTALERIGEVHVTLLAEADRKHGEYDLPALVTKARALAAQVSEFRRTILDTFGS
jgi:hypothetical protein